MPSLGITRSAHRGDHLLQTPDTFVRAPLPGMRKATAVVHIAPASGARFTEYTAEFEAGGVLGALIASLLMGVAESLGIQYIGADSGLIVVFALLLLTLAIKPTGLGGKAR